MRPARSCQSGPLALRSPTPAAFLCSYTCTHEKKTTTGTDRKANVFIPPSYDGRTKFPIWMHIHGVYWASMGDVSARAGYTVPAIDATPVWDTLADGELSKHALIVYPQSTGDPYKRMFWNLPWWRCSVGVCIDSSVDDIGFIEKLTATLPGRFAGGADPRRFYLSGTSAGGMMVENLLCQSSAVQSRLSAAVSILGGIGENFAPSCHPTRAVPLMLLHGEADTVIGYYSNTNVDGSQFLSTREFDWFFCVFLFVLLHLKLRACTHTPITHNHTPLITHKKTVAEAKMWQAKRGCSGEPRPYYSNSVLDCSDYCARGGPMVRLCGMKGVGHELNNPTTGYPFGVAWRFLSSYR